VKGSFAVTVDTDYRVRLAWESRRWGETFAHVLSGIIPNQKKDYTQDRLPQNCTGTEWFIGWYQKHLITENCPSYLCITGVTQIHQ